MEVQESETPQNQNYKKQTKLAKLKRKKTQAFSLQCETIKVGDAFHISTIQN